MAGRWVGRDVWDNLVEKSLYSFVLNKPMTHIDVLGMFSARKIANCGDVKVTYLGKEWKPDTHLQPTSFWTKEPPLVTWTWKRSKECKELKEKYYDGQHSMVFIKQIRVENFKKAAKNNHKLLPGETAIYGKSGWSEMILAGYIPNDQWHIYMNRYIGGHPSDLKEQNQKNSDESYLVKIGVSAPYVEPNEAIYAMNIPPVGPASTGKYAGMRIQVYVRCGRSTIWKTDSYYWFKKRM